MLAEQPHLRRLFDPHQLIDLPSISLKSPPANQDNCGIRTAHFPNFIIVGFAKISVVNSSSMVFMALKASTGQRRQRVIRRVRYAYLVMFVELLFAVEAFTIGTAAHITLSISFPIGMLVHTV